MMTAAVPVGLQETHHLLVVVMMMMVMANEREGDSGSTPRRENGRPTKDPSFNFTKTHQIG